MVSLLTKTLDHHPAVPIGSFPREEVATKVLGGRPFGICVVCRRGRKKNPRSVLTLGETAGGRFIGVKHLPHWGSQIGSLIQTATYIHRAYGGRCSLLGIPFSRYGLSQKSLHKMPVLMRDLLAKAAGASERAQP